MTLAQAADIWIRFKKVEKEVEAAREKLIDHFEKTGRTTYKGKIGYSVSYRTVLDQAKVKEFLGAKLPRFQRKSKTRQLSLLG